MAWSGLCAENSRALSPPLRRGITHRMKRNPTRDRRDAFQAAERLLGREVAGGDPLTVLAPPDWRDTPPGFCEPEPEPIEPPPDISHHAARKAKGRPRGGIRQAAREAGMSEGAYRRRRAVGLTADAAEAFHTAPVPLSRAALDRIGRCPPPDMLAAVHREIAAATGPRRPSELTRLRRRVAELEAENQRLRAALMAAPSGQA